MTVENIDSEAQPTFGVANSLTFTTKTHCLRNMFRCTAENYQTGMQLSTVERLNLVCSPRHDSRKQSTNMITGKLKTTASLTADVIANPLPNFTWYHYQGMTPVPVVVGKDKVVLTNGLQSVLKVHIKRDEDYGIYRVVVQNSVGTTSLFFSLTNDVLTPETPSWNILPVAAGEGVVIVMLIVAIVVIVYRRSLFKVGLKKGGVDSSGETITGQRQDDSCQRGREVDGTLPAETNTYSSVETEADKQTYTELREFETVGDSPTQGDSSYESLHERTPQVYEDIKRPTLVNGKETN
ncbi:uncharacterized protein [Haliotis cracherodii]|uniref:uncharacterized protein n=1 Tax=Haliotis cracherodii TaxID=6455 RepID=UPI0039EBE874